VANVISNVCYLSQVQCIGFFDITKHFLGCSQYINLCWTFFCAINICKIKELRTEGPMEHPRSIGPINTHFWRSARFYTAS